MLRPLSALVLLLAAGCSSSSATDPVPSAASATPSDSPPPPPAAGPDAGKPKPDAAAPTASWQDGIAGKSCADACQALGKTCSATCVTHMSCGSDDDKGPPYAGYACYYHESKDGSFRTNDGRSLKTCDEVATTTWTHYGAEETLGDYLGRNPVSCCCM